MPWVADIAAGPVKDGVGFEIRVQARSPEEAAAEAQALMRLIGRDAIIATRLEPTQESGKDDMGHTQHWSWCRFTVGRPSARDTSRG